MLAHSFSKSENVECLIITESVRAHYELMIIILGLNIALTEEQSSASVNPKVQIPSINIYVTTRRLRRLIIWTWRLISCKFLCLCVLEWVINSSLNQIHTETKSLPLRESFSFNRVIMTSATSACWDDQFLKINKHRTTSNLATAMLPLKTGNHCITLVWIVLQQICWMAAIWLFCIFFFIFYFF